MTNITIPPGLDTEICVLGDDTLAQVPAVLEQLWPGQTPVIIADQNTWKVAGADVRALLTKAGQTAAPAVIFPGKPMLTADYLHIKELVPALRGNVPVAVGSGTINDLVKCASDEAGCHGYLCVATAPSVDGYTSSGAALTVNGVKKTVPCPAPKAILADNRVLGSAPLPMIAAGYADLAAKVVAGADWHIAATLDIVPYNQTAWNLVQKDLRSWLADPEGLRRREPRAMSALFTGLAATGFAMQHMGDSRPASGAEHLFSHVWEMEGLTFEEEHPSHGFKVAIGTLISTRMMNKIFALDANEVQTLLRKTPLPTADERQKQIDHFLQDSLATMRQEVSQVAMGKLLTGKKLEQRRKEIVARWPEMQQKVQQQLLPEETLRKNFQILSCPTEPAQIGLTAGAVHRGIMVAGMIRNRYTILDLLQEMGMMQEISKEILN